MGKQLASTLKHYSLAIHCSYYYVILQSLKMTPTDTPLISRKKLKRASITIQSTWLLSLYFTLPVFFPYLFCSTPGHQLEWKPFPTQHLLQLLACGSQRWKYCYTLAYSVKKRSIGKKIEKKYQDGYGDSQFNLNTITSTKQGNAWHLVIIILLFPLG